MIKESITIEQTIAFLNELLQIDSLAVARLVDARVECNKMLADHPTVQVMSCGDGNNKTWRVGILGFLNGLFGADDEGYGAIKLVFDVYCKNDSLHNKFLTKETIVDKCPICNGELILGRPMYFKQGRQC